MRFRQALTDRVLPERYVLGLPLTLYLSRIFAALDSNMEDGETLGLKGRCNFGAKDNTAANAGDSQIRPQRNLHMQAHAMSVLLPMALRSHPEVQAGVGPLDRPHLEGSYFPAFEEEAVTSREEAWYFSLIRIKFRQFSLLTLLLIDLRRIYLHVYLHLYLLSELASLRSASSPIPSWSRLNLEPRDHYVPTRSFSILLMILLSHRRPDSGCDQVSDCLAEAAIRKNIARNSNPRRFATLISTVRLELCPRTRRTVTRSSNGADKSNQPGIYPMARLELLEQTMVVMNAAVLYDESLVTKSSDAVNDRLVSPPTGDGTAVNSNCRPKSISGVCRPSIRQIMQHGAGFDQGPVVTA